MDYSVGETLRVDGDLYTVIGKIRYRNRKDQCCWEEYRLQPKGGYGREKWLSCDDIYKEYSISEGAWNVSRAGYHLVDSGEEIVDAVWGSVDVEVGDRAQFMEYEDATEEKIISSEIWDDGEEISVGYYLDPEEIESCGDGLSYDPAGSGGGLSYASTGFGGGRSGMDTKKVSNLVSVISVLIICLIPLVNLASIFGFSLKSHSIEKYVKKSTSYGYLTSITGEQKQKAQVYRSFLDLDATARDIIDGIEGDTEDVQQNTEDGDNTIAILTAKEYCLIYVSEDNEVLVQISSRKYAYTTDATPYRSRARTYRYFRRFYYSRGYAYDSTRYGKNTSPYSAGGDSMLASDSSSDFYHSYSDSVRQSSIRSRSSSGGGLSSGK